MMFFSLKVISAAVELGDLVAAELRRMRACGIKLTIAFTFFAACWALDWKPDETWGMTGQMLFVIAGVSLMAAIAISRNFHWTIGAFYFWVMVQWIRLRLAHVSIMEIVMVNAMIFAAIFIVKEDKRQLLPRLLILDAVLQSLLGASEVLGFFPFHRLTAPTDFVWAPLGAIGNPTLLGPYLAMALPFLFSMKLVRHADVDLLVRAIATMLILAMIYFCQSTMAWITVGTIITLTFGFTFGLRPFLFALGAGSSILGIVWKFFPKAAYLTGRQEPWGIAWESLVWYGHGAGTWMPVSFKLHVARLAALEKAGTPLGGFSTFFGQVHMDPLQGAFEFGWVGMIPLALAALILAGITLWGIKNRDKEVYPWACLFFGILADSMGSYPLHTPAMGLLFTVAAARLFQARTASRSLMEAS